MNHRGMSAPMAFGLSIAFFAACLASPVSSQSSDAILAEECKPFRWHPIALWLDADVVRQGETILVRAGSTLRRATGVIRPDPMPTACLSDWRISPAGAAEVSADGSTLTIARDAPAGVTLTLEVRTPGEPAHYATTIIGRDEAVLNGTWSQREVSCADALAPGRPVRELTFNPNGRFSVTWTPFETYTDYWGSFFHDAATGQLRLEVTGANRNPPRLTLSGEVELTENGRQIVLTGIDLGDGQHVVLDRRCRYTFDKI